MKVEFHLSRPDHRVVEIHRGKSGLHRAKRWVTPTRSNPRESATESKPPAFMKVKVGKGETVV